MVLTHGETEARVGSSWLSAKLLMAAGRRTWLVTPPEGLFLHLQSLTHGGKGEGLIYK